MTLGVVGRCVGEAGRREGTVTGSKDSKTLQANLTLGPSFLYIGMVVVNLCQMDWPQGAQIKDYFGVSVRVFADETNI